jgi:quinol monooxygenase YgiN
MTYVRYYRMTARDGQGTALRAALETLLAKVEPLAGCQGVELLNDADKADIYVLLERWTSGEAHKEGGRMLGKEAFAPIMAVLSSPPESASLNTLD